MNNERPILFNGEMVRAILDGRKTQTRRVIKNQPPTNFYRHCWFSAPIYGFTNQNCPTDNWHKIRCPYGYKNYHLWVRETFVLENTIEYHGDHIIYNDRPVNKIFSKEYGEYWLIPHYRSTEIEPNIVPFNTFDWFDDRTRWSPSIHMPRWASRITLDVKNIRVERLQEISEEDAIAEGVEPNCAMLNHANCDHENEYIHYGRDDDDFPAFSTKESFQSLWEKIKGADSWSQNPWVWVVEFEKFDN